MIYVKRVHVDTYQTDTGQLRKATPVPYVKLDVIYDTPARLSQEVENEPATSKRLDIAKRHVLKYNGTPAFEQSMEQIRKMGGMVNPTTVIDSIEAREVAKLLWGVRLGMCRTGRVWIDVVKFIPEYLIGDLPKKAMQYLVRNGDLRKCPVSGHIALGWAAKLDDEFTAKYKKAGISFKLEDGPNSASPVSTEVYHPLKHKAQNPYRCIEPMIQRMQHLPVTCTTLFHAQARPMLIPSIPEPTVIKFQELRTSTASNIEKIKLILTVSHRGSISFAPYAGKIQMQAYQDYQDILQKGDLFWTERIHDPDRKTLQIWIPNQSKPSVKVTLEEMLTFANPLESCTYNSFLKVQSIPMFDSIILVHPLPHARFYFEAKARARVEVKYVKIDKSADT